jgi:hypothetical protein
MKKFKAQEQEKADEEERHKQTLYEVEKKFIIGKDKYVPELEKFPKFVPLSFVMKYYIDPLYFYVFFLLLRCINLCNFYNAAEDSELYFMYPLDEVR